MDETDNLEKHITLNLDKNVMLSASSSLHVSKIQHKEKIVLYKKRSREFKRTASEDRGFQKRSFKNLLKKPDDEYFKEKLIFKSVIDELVKLKRPKI